MKPFTINLQINVYPDGTVQVNPSLSESQDTAQPSTSGASTAAIEAPRSTKPAAPQSPPSTESTASTSASPTGPASPSESDVRAALLAAVKASDKATAVAVLKTYADVERVPDVPEEKRALVIAELNALVVAAKA